MNAQFSVPSRVSRSAAGGRGQPLRPLRWALAATLVAGVLALLLGRGLMLRAVGNYLMVDDPLAPASAIIVLAGGTPQRETEAAELFREGWANRVIIVEGINSPGQTTGATPTSDGNERIRTLRELGVPDDAIVVAIGHVDGTLEELAVARSAVQAQDPVILVTSKFHTRRVEVAWDHLTNGSIRGIVRAAPLDPFDPDHWWAKSEMVASVTHEYLGLVQLFASPVLPLVKPQ